MPPKKPFAKKFKIQLPAGAAAPGQKLGPVLGQYGLNMMQFCQTFNDMTADQKASGMMIPVICYVFDDKTFELETKTPPATDLIKKELGITKGSGKANTVKIGKITRAQLEKIAGIKMKDLNANDMDAAVKIIEGSCRQMGVETIN